MAGRLEHEIKQTRPFGSVQEEVVLSVVRTADQIVAPLAELLRQSNLSLSQYNTLRILRGSGGEALTCGEISERLVRRDPDVTRLLDRLESRGLVARTRSTTDRRIVRTAITKEGMRLVASLDEPVTSAVKQTLKHMSATRLRLLNELLEEARGVGESTG